jgi:Domain of unknown function (DUF4126)
MSWESLLSICLGLGLAAACGFRVFLPLLALSAAAHGGLLELNGRFAWLGANPALITLGVATVLEIGAYYIPWLDHLLDVAATPVAILAGVVTTASVVTGLDPLVRWSLAVIAGGGIAASAQTLSAGVRGLSTLTTGGLGNFLVSTAELGAAVGLALLALFLPLAVGGVLLVLGLGVARRAFRSDKAPATA